MEQVALSLLSSYGSTILSEYIKDVPRIHQEVEVSLIDKAQMTIDRNRDILGTAQALTSLLHESKDINQFVEVALTGFSKASQFYRCSFWMVSRDRSIISTRITFMKDASPIDFECTINLVEEPNVMNYVFNSGQTVIVLNKKEIKRQDFISHEISTLMANGGLCVFPVKIGSVIIGVISGQVSHENCVEDKEAFAQYQFLVEHLNMFLSMVVGR